jgi:zinc protease
MTLARCGAILALGLCALSGQALPPGMTKIGSVEGITEYRLQNGLRVLLFPDPGKTTVTVNITYLVGSRHENYGETGMAHLLEHLVFRGTPRHKDIPKELTDHGTRPNGTTSFDRTNYFETMKATEENLRWALDLESDRMVNSFISKEHLDAEMTVVRNEFEMGENNPTRVLIQRMAATAYLWHNYGKTTIGARSDIENVDIGRLQAFYKRYYQPDNAVLMVAGKIDEQKTAELVSEYFAKIPKPSRVLERTYTEEPVQDGERSIVVRRVGDQKLVMAQYHVPPGAHPDNPALNILAGILGNAPSGRLYKALVETKKATSVSSFVWDLREPGMFFQMVTLRKDGDQEEARKILIETLENAKDKPVTAEEVERSRRDLVKDFELQLNDTERVGLFMSEFVAGGDWRLLFWARDRVESATVEDVQRVAAKYLKQSNRTLGVFIPEDKPDRAEIEAAPDPAVTLKDYKGRRELSQGEAFDPSPTNIDKRTERGAFPGGIKYALLSKRNRGGKVNLQLTLRFGDEKTLFGKAASGSAAGALLNRGTTTMTRQQIQDEFDKLKTQVRFSGTPASAEVSLETTRPNLIAALKLAGKVLREASFPQNEFDQWKQRALNVVEAQLREPQAIAGLEFSRHLNRYPKGDIRYRRTPDEEVADLNALTVDDVKKFYKDFYGAPAGEFAVAGDFDVAEVKQAAAEALAGWKSPVKYTRITNIYQDVEAKSVNFETPDKANAMMMAGFPVRISDESPDYPALTIGNFMLGGGFLNSRLAVRIRQKEGLSYGVGSMLQVTPKEDAARFAVYAIFAPQNAEKVEAAMREEIARALKDGFTEEEVKAAKSGWLQQRQVSRGQDGELANALAVLTHNGRTMMFQQQIESKVDTLSPGEVNAALKKYIDSAKLSVIKAGDFAKAKAGNRPAPR